jgi:hypothetical protein
MDQGYGSGRVVKIRSKRREKAEEEIITETRGKSEKRKGVLSTKYTKNAKTLQMRRYL